jgi:hypothetical protein
MTVPFIRERAARTYIYEGLILRFMKSRRTYNDATNIVGTAWSTKCYMNMRPLYQPQLMQTEAVA